jgi:tetratricopeptide (TPR) repeat protein
MLSKESNLKRNLLFLPARKNLCLCGSAKKFKHCCAETYDKKRPTEAVFEAFNQSRYRDALLQCRADITQYTIWHKRHTEPLVRAGVDSIQPLLEIDIKALSELVDLLFNCYTKLGMLEDFPAVLERLRRNINDERWHRKIIYFQAICALFPDWNRDAGRRELKKLEPLEDENDVEIIKLYIDLFGMRLTFSTKQKLIDRIINLSESKIDHLHYRGLRATNYLLIGDDKKAEHELREAIEEYRVHLKPEKQNTYEKLKYGETIALFGTLKKDMSILDEAIAVFKDIVIAGDLTQLGRALMYRNIGDTERQKNEWALAAEAYEKASNIDQSVIIYRIFLSECYLQLGKELEALEIIRGIDKKRLDNGEKVDYVFRFAEIAVTLPESGMLNEAEKLLRDLQLNSPYFKEIRDTMLLSVLETRIAGKSISIIGKAKRALKDFTKIATRYLILKPNLMGIGLDVGKIIDDVSKGAREHSSNSPNQKFK